MEWLPAGRGRGSGGDPREIFESLDVNEDGLLTGDEPAPFMRQSEYFTDGQVTVEEFVKAMQELQSRRVGRPNRQRGGGQVGGSGGSSPVQNSDIEFLATLDSDQGRSLTETEVHQAINKKVIENMSARTSLDGNQDGEVTPQEYALSQPSTGGSTDADGLDDHARGHFNREGNDRDGIILTQEISVRVAASLLRRVMPPERSEMIDHVLK